MTPVQMRLVAVPPDDQRFQQKISKNPEGCWLWKGSHDRNGYPRFSIDGVNQLAHRYVYEKVLGKIPKGKFLVSSCEVRSCVNPRHHEVRRTTRRASFELTDQEAQDITWLVRNDLDLGKSLEQACLGAAAQAKIPVWAVKHLVEKSYPQEKRFRK